MSGNFWSMKLTGQKDKLVKRSQAADLIGVGARTLRRYETAGLLTPIKPNCRLVLYRLADVEKIQSGDIQTAADRPTEAVLSRTAGGTFAARPGKAGAQ
jgi:hypothetical protein